MGDFRSYELRVSNPAAKKAAFDDMREYYKKEGKAVITFDVSKAFKLMAKMHELAVSKYVQYYATRIDHECFTEIVDLTRFVNWAK